MQCRGPVWRGKVPCRLMQKCRGGSPTGASLRFGASCHTRAICSRNRRSARASRSTGLPRAREGGIVERQRPAAGAPCVWQP
jgi:hypothetical protein